MPRPRQRNLLRSMTSLVMTMTSISTMTVMTKSQTTNPQPVRPNPSRKNTKMYRLGKKRFPTSSNRPRLLQRPQRSQKLTKRPAPLTTVQNPNHREDQHQNAPVLIASDPEATSYPSFSSRTASFAGVAGSLQTFCRHSGCLDRSNIFAGVHAMSPLF